jgi:hypothetical protein
MVDLPGNEGANKGYWRVQIRDRYGRFVEMGGDITFEISLPGGGRAMVPGIYRGSVRPDVAKIEVLDDKYIPKGMYEVGSHFITAIKKDKEDENKTNLTGVPDATVETPPEPKKLELAAEIDGDTAFSIIRGAQGLHAKKATGRAAFARTPDDVIEAAHLQYIEVYNKLKEEYPDLVSQFANAEEYWAYAKNSLAVSDTTPWANSVKDIPELMKASNKIYARDFLGLKEDGLITFYRNAVNHKPSEERSAAGYASFDKRMAWDYNSYLIKYEGVGEHDGRYEVKAKPEELTGLLGYSQIQDEYGVVIGLDVVSMPGRMKRVGGLEIQEPSPWAKTIDTFDRSGGASPFRQFRTASHFDLYPIPADTFPGDDYQAFMEKNGIVKGGIPAKWEEIYGEGSWNEVDGKYPAYARLKELFVDAGGGKIGLDTLALDKYLARAYSDNESKKPEKNDYGDLAVKMLTVLQELSGTTFMVHRGHNQGDKRVIEAESKASPGDVPNVIDVVNKTAEDRSAVEPKGPSTISDLVSGYKNIISRIEELDSSPGPKVEKGNTPMRVLLESMGKAGKPEMVDPSVLAGKKIIYRGGSSFGIDSLKYSETDRIGLGVTGDGYYFSNKTETADVYASMSPDGDEGSVVSAVWSPTAKVYEFTDEAPYYDDKTALQAKATEAAQSAIKALHIETNASEAEQEIYDNFYESDMDALTTSLILEGYDGMSYTFNRGIEGKEETYTIVFNREALQIADI